MIKECPFCSEIESRSRVISETQDTMTILSNPTLVQGHYLVVPKRHVEKFSEMNDEELRDLFSKVINWQELLLKKNSGCDIRQNYRPFLKQSRLKVNHLHVHLIPREFEDELYGKCQIYEREIFKELNQKELDETLKELKKLMI